jgi:hypothetical protein
MPHFPFRCGDNRREAKSDCGIIQCMANDTSRPTATDDDKHTLTIERVADLYSAAGHSRTIRTLQRYCVTGHLDCLKAPTKLGDMYLVTPESVARHVAELTEISATTSVATDRGEPRPTATNDAAEIKHSGLPETIATVADISRLTAADRDHDARYVARLEGEVEFLRGQVGTKDAQIKELTERSRETNVLIGGLQRMLAPLLTAPEKHDQPKDVSDEN